MSGGLYTLSGFAVGVLVGLTGVGGGSLMTPLLVVLFEVHPTTAVGTDLLFATSTKTVGKSLHGFSRNIDWRVVGWLATGSVPATGVTLFALSRLNLSGEEARELITLALGAVLLLTAAFLLFGRAIRASYADRLARLAVGTIRVLTVGLGAAMGVLVTTTSVGAGAIGVTLLLFLFPKMPASRIVGSDIAHAVPLTLVAGGGHWYLNSVDWALLSPLLMGSLPGIALGSTLAGRVPESAVRTALALVLAVVGLRLMI
jgi:uncharacterized membrane protein YfcA